VLGQLGNRVQHALRAFTPRDQKAVKIAAQTFRANPNLDIETVITQLGVGEALVSFLDDKGIPGITERAWILPPRSNIGAITDEQRAEIMKGSIVAGVYEQVVDRESAFEKLKAQADELAAAAEQESLQKEADAAQKKAEAEQRQAEAAQKKADAEQKRQEAQQAREEAKAAREAERLAKQKAREQAQLQREAAARAKKDPFAQILGDVATTATKEISRGLLGNLFGSSSAHRRR
jgi:flagellar biosynthesis GTPase FlhF